MRYAATIRVWVYALPWWLRWTLGPIILFVIFGPFTPTVIAIAVLLGIVGK